MRWFAVSLGLLVIFIALMFAPTSGGQGSLLLERSDSYVSIGENLAREKVTLGYVVSENTENILQDNFRIHGALSSVNVYDSDSKENLPFFVDNLENGWSLVRYSFRETLRAGERSEVTVEFTKAVENLAGNRVYKIKYLWSMTPTSYQVVVKLPKGSSLVNPGETPLEFYTENESLYMKYAGVMRSSFQTSIVFTPPPGEELPPEEEQQVEGGQTLLPYVVLTIAAVAFPIAVWTVWRTRVAKPPEAPKMVPKAVPRLDTEKILRMLHESERKVVKALIQEDNLTQAELCGRTGIPKSTLSRILMGLEQKGVVRRVEHGMSKKVMLTGWAKGWKEGEG